MDAPALEALYKLIATRYGLDFQRSKTDTLQAFLQQRMQAYRITSLQHYIEVLQQQEEECLRVVQHMTVNETYFLREPAHLTHMTERVLPALLNSARPGERRKLRLLSAGCSSGEEAYSMAALVGEMAGAGKDWDFEVFGIDIDVQAIEKARQGLFNAYSFRSCPEAFRTTYFDEIQPGIWQIHNEVKRNVTFALVNLFSEVYPDFLAQMDVIFYRNVSIYFPEGKHELIFQRLNNLLKPGGALFLSSAETMRYTGDGSSLVKENGVFYFTKRVRSATMVPPPNYSLPREAAPAVALPRRVRERKIPAIPRRASVKAEAACSLTVADKMKQCMSMVEHKQYSDVLGILDEIIAEQPSHVQALLIRAHVYLNQQDFIKVEYACRQALTIDSFCLEAYMLLGQAARLALLLTDAVEYFKKAIYLRPDCWLAHFWLAEVFREEEALGYAKREYSIAKKLLEQGLFSCTGLSFFTLPFTAEQFIQLCTHMMNKLSAV